MYRPTRSLTSAAATVAATAVVGAGAVALLAAAPAGATSASHASTPARCADGQVQVTIDPRHIPGNGAVGRDGRRVRAVLVDFENVSARACTLFGYPGAAIVGYDGSAIRQATRTTHGNYGPTKPTTVTLRPRHYAAGYLEGEQSSTPGNCGERYPRVLLTPPDIADPVTFTVGWPKCYSFLVHPVQTLHSGR